MKQKEIMRQLRAKIEQCRNRQTFLVREADPDKIVEAHNLSGKVEAYEDILEMIKEAP